MYTILQINVTANSGSHGRIAEDIGKLIIYNGWKSYIAYGRWAQPSKSHLIRIGNKWDILFHGIQTRLFDRHGLASKRATRKLIKRIKEINPDIIHLHNIHGYYLNFPILFAYLKEANIPVVWTLHDCWSMTGHCSHFTFAQCERWKSQCRDCPERRSYPSSLWMDRSSKNYKEKKVAFAKLPNLTLVPVSDWLKDIVKSSFLKDKSLHRIYNGVDLNVFKPSAVKRHDAKVKLIGVASVWSERKGLKDFISLRKILPAEQYEMTVVGVNKKQLSGLPTDIKGIERTENVNQLAQLYSEADVFINPTYEETFGLTTIEGMACGTPGIVYNCTASPELVTPQTGRIVEQGDIEGIVKAVNELMALDQEMLSKACRQRAVENFNKDERYQEYINIYEHILNTNS